MVLLRSRTWPGSHALPAPYRAAAALLPTLADPGYERAGLGIHIPSGSPPAGRTWISIPAPAMPSRVPGDVSVNGG